jgi:hypothetical protein
MVVLEEAQVLQDNHAETVAPVAVADIQGEPALHHQPIAAQVVAVAHITQALIRIIQPVLKRVMDWW